MQNSKIHYADSQYPDLLREISSPPMTLYIHGTLNHTPLVAIVGSRRPTDYGRQVTYQLASELAHAGVGIVSGLALGIDAAAHLGALDAGGVTIAILGSGLKQIYPTGNRSLADRILKNEGAIISELPDDAPAMKHHFPARNRIIAGLSLAVLVTEAARNSGSLITANFGLEQNRLVMAVPGNITSMQSHGTNQLIQAGAHPITSAKDVLEALNITGLPKTPIKPSNAQENIVLNLMEEGVSSTKDLLEQSGLTAAELGRVISMMEISGKIRGLGAGVWVKR